MLTIGEVAQRAGVATSALRFYEDYGFIHSERTTGNQRRYRRSVIRIVSVIKAGQAVGLELADIHRALETLPKGRAPTKKDWGRMSRAWRDELDLRIERMQALRADLAGCIGCGCLSLASCAIFNPADVAAQAGDGARYLAGDEAPTAG
jgi:MerR family redox-sensitive transcriptional activator SoxR